MIINWENEPESGPDQCGIRTADNNYEPCSNEVAYKYGTRCRNGCLGEGVMEFVCRSHSHFLVITNEAFIECNHCHEIGVTETFPLQEV